MSQPERKSRLQALRERAALTQAEVARALKVSEITVRHWEAGLRTPRTSRLKAYARVLGCAVGELL